MLISGFQVMFVFLLSFIGVFMLYIDRTRKGQKVYIRRIPGFDALDEAVGRCTEMGRPLFYTFGIGELDTNVLASFDVLMYVSRQCAKTDTDIIVGNARPEVQPMTEELVRSAYVQEGKPDAYKADNVRFLNQVQTAYMSAVLGIFERERPAANLMLGPFFAESMMIAEAGNRIGAIQIGGTGRTIQIPFFVAACDYTLIGDELFTAGAYIGRKPEQVGAVYAQDFGKIFALIMMLIGALMATGGSSALRDFLGR